MTSELHITAKDTLSIIRCMIATHRKDNPKKEIPVEWVSGVCGPIGEEYCELRGGGYFLSCSYRGGMLDGCRVARTPSGKEWNHRLDSGDPFSQLNLEDRKHLTAMMLDKKKDEYTCEALQVWVLSTNGSKPYSAILYHSKEDAEAAAEEQRGFHAKYSKTKTEVKDEEKEVKTQMKETNAVPYGRRRKIA